MDSRLAKILIIILVIIIVVVSILGIVLYIFTDMLKSNDVLFKKYVAQNISSIAEVFDVSTEESYIKTLDGQDYSEKIDATIKYLEDSNDKEEEYTISEEGMTKNSTDELYKKITATYEDEKLLEIEALGQDNIYGFRLSNLVQQFVSVENLNLSYFISSMGYDGTYFSDKLEKVDLSGVLDFSDEEIETLKQRYISTIFTDIDSKNYSSQRNAMVTLNNGQSITTTSYSLTITQNDLDKIYKRTLNQAISDEIILSKIEKIDEKIQEAGIVEPEGESLKEKYISKLQSIADGIEYSGTDNRQIVVTVYPVKGQTVRIGIKTELTEIALDFDNTNGNELSLKLAEEGNETKIYSIGKQLAEGTIIRTLSYKDGEVYLSIETNMAQTNDGISTSSNLNYSNAKITNLYIGATMEQKLDDSLTIPVAYNEGNNILLNDYDGDKILSILDSLKQREIDNLEKIQSNVNTKLLNNILIWIDAKEKAAEEEKANNIELQKTRFNNKFELYEGENLNYEYVQKLIKAVSNNMSDYKIISGNQIEIIIEEGVSNEEKAESIASVITSRNTYNVEMKYSDDGYVNAIDISVYEKK
jgi:hypothetical protein